MTASIGDPILTIPDLVRQVEMVGFESSRPSSVRNKILLRSYLLILLIEGTKTIQTTDQTATSDGREILLLPPGHYLMTEKIASIKGKYEALLIFFSNEAGLDFFSRFPIDSSARSKERLQVYTFDKDEFISNYIGSISIMMKRREPIPADLQLIKLNELLLYLQHSYPDRMASLRQRAVQDITNIEFRRVVEANVAEHFNLDELAFLCHMSLSTFKRKFKKLYGQIPSKWFADQRVRLACTLLRSGRGPAQIYDQVGFESHSSFTHAFKQVLGVTPKQYQQNMQFSPSTSALIPTASF